MASAPGVLEKTRPIDRAQHHRFRFVHRFGGLEDLLTIQAYFPHCQQGKETPVEACGRMYLRPFIHRKGFHPASLRLCRGKHSQAFLPTDGESMHMKPSRAEEISIEEIQRYLNKFLPRKCDFCDSTKWTVFNDGLSHPSVAEPCLQALTPDGSPVVMLGGAVPVVQIQCLGCGQMKYFSLSAIIAKIKESKNA